MSWMQKLYETYENCQGEIGKMREGQVPLLPVFHSTQQAQIEVVVDEHGNWIDASVIEEKAKRTIIIPCTEKSSSRANGITPHPLFDKLCYVAGDYAEYCGEKAAYFEAYIGQLADWCRSPYSHPAVTAIYTYLQKRRLMRDLIDAGILYQAEDGTLPEKWKGEKAPPLFAACVGSPLDAFVRFRVLYADPEHADIPPWNDPAVWQSYIDYQKQVETTTDYCYVLGKSIPPSATSPKYILQPGDQAKLISGNDTSGFTFRGRFSTADEAYCVGQETTDKAHSALRWLISRHHALLEKGMAILAFGTNGQEIKGVKEDTFTLFGELAPQEPVIDTMEDFAARFRKAAFSYRQDLRGWEEAVVIGLKSATPGRVSIFYYHEIPAEDLINRIFSWHETCRWRLSYRQVKTGEKDNKGNDIYRHITFEGAPSLKDIITAAYSERIENDKEKKLKKSAMERLLPCVVDGAMLPADIMQSVIHRAANPVAMEDWEAKKCLEVACALIRKYANDKVNGRQIKDENYQEVWKLALDPTCTDRSYLLGRALAYAHQIESYALNKNNEERMTNAIRLRQAFVQRPGRTWKIIDNKLQPYIQRIYGDKSYVYLTKGLNTVLTALSKDEFNDTPVSPQFYLGYSSQINAFFEKKEPAENDNEKGESEHVDAAE